MNRLQAEVLMTAYSDLRVSARHPATVAVTLYTLQWAIFAALGAVFVRECSWNPQQCGRIPDLLVAFLALIPVAVMAFIVMLNSSGLLRDVQIQAIEFELRRSVGAYATLPPSSPIPQHVLGIPSFHSLREPAWLGMTAGALWIIVYATQLIALWGGVYVAGQVTSISWALLPGIPLAIVTGALVVRVGGGKRFAWRLLRESRQKDILIQSKEFT